MDDDDDQFELIVYQVDRWEKRRVLYVGNRLGCERLQVFLREPKNLPMEFRGSDRRWIVDIRRTSLGDSLENMTVEQCHELLSQAERLAVRLMELCQRLDASVVKRAS